MWFRKPLLDVVKITRRIGEDEILEVSFNAIANDPIGNDTISRTGRWLDFLLDRMLDRNKRVLEVGATQPTAENVVKRVK